MTTHMHAHACTLTRTSPSMHIKHKKKHRTSGYDTAESSACTVVQPATTGLRVIKLENRPNSPATQDHTPSGEPFHGFTQMEFTALPQETEAMLAATNMGGSGTGAYRVFLTDRRNHVRMFKAAPLALPAVWARSGGEQLSLADTAAVGEYFTFQVGIYNPGAAPAVNLSIAFDDLRPSARSSGRAGAGRSTMRTIPASAFNCFNTGGVDEHGIPFTKTYSVGGNGDVGSMWVGVQLPDDVSPGTYTSTMTLTSAGSTTPPKSLTLTIAVSEPAGVPGRSRNSGGGSMDHGDADVYGMSRLRWLDSTIGIDDNVTKPFVPLVVMPAHPASSPASGGFRIRTVNKEILIAENGFVQAAVVTANKVRKGQPAPVDYPLLTTDGVSIELLGTASPTAVPASVTAIPLAVTSAAKVVKQTDSEVSWTSTLSGAGVSVQVNSTFDFTSYLQTTMAFTGSAHLSDIQLRFTVPQNQARYMLGMGNEGRQINATEIDAWRWNNHSGQCDVWLGRVEAGVYLKLIGSGTRWENPQYSRDYPIIPFVPPTWGGVGSPNGEYGVNFTTVRAAAAASAARQSQTKAPHKAVSEASSNLNVLVFSGPRTLGAAASENNTFRFDMMFTPSKPLNQTKHWADRYFQVGYGTSYETPQTMKDMGVSVVTLHQGIGGIHNGTMVNPYINWPFEPEVVNFLENYTSQAHDLGLRVKYYYTIRELSNHAVELFALKALQGEIITDETPYTIPQKGYCHDWDCHGGAVYLHEHVVNDYVYCWQQSLANGEWDAAVCDIGVSRWFNYYVTGLDWSVNQAPHIDGIYYDGINFDRQSFRRVRKILDSRGPGARIDMHTGEVADEPSSVRYIGHFPFADTAWNGEGFKWGNDKHYYLVDASGLQHGISADMLGGGGVSKGMLFAMTARNNGQTPAIWKFWDTYNIQQTTMVGWWEDDSPVSISVAHALALPTPQNPTLCEQQMLASIRHGSYHESDMGTKGNIAFGPMPGPGCGYGRNQTSVRARARARVRVCVGFCMCVSVPLCARIRVCTCVSVVIFVRVRVRACVRARAISCARVRLHVRVHARVHVRACECACAGELPM